MKAAFTKDATHPALDQGQVSLRGPWKPALLYKRWWDLGGDKNLQEKLTPELPVRVIGPRGAEDKAPWPVLVLFNGFLARSPWYHLLAEHAASWGYAVVQYDSPIRRQVTLDGVHYEVMMFEPLLAWLKASRDWQLRGRLDLTRLVAAGHSRGGKLAALMFAEAKLGCRAAYLVDPVDLFDPSGVNALKRAGRPVGITGCGVWGPFNPPLVNYQAFFDAAAPGSWLVRLPRVTHLQVCDAGEVGNWWLDHFDKFPEWVRTYFLAQGLDALLSLVGEPDSDKLSKSLEGDHSKIADVYRIRKQLAQELKEGRPTQAALVREEVARLTAAPMLAWFDRSLKASPPSQPSAAFLSWVKQEEGNRRLSFDIKGKPKETPA